MTSPPFERFYASFAQQPLLLWGAAAVGLAVVLLRRSTSRSVQGFCLLFGLVPFLDAWLTADDVAGVGALSPTLGVVVATFFVILGDLRFFLFLESATGEGEIALDGGKWARAIGLSFVIPVASALFRAFLPEAAPWRGRATFLFYEAVFVCLVLALRALGRGGRLGWTRRVTQYVLAYYALWILADVLILFLHLDVGYLVRVVPNVLYYGGLLAVVSVASPPRPS